MLGVTAHGPVPHHHDNSEGTDVVTFVEEFEGKVSSVLIGQWEDDVGQGVWSLAERCIHNMRNKRPNSTEVCSTTDAILHNDAAVIIIIVLHMCRSTLHFWP